MTRPGAPATAVALTALAAAALAAAGPPQFAVRVDAVRVDVLVTEAGRIVTGLGPGDFEVLDNGVPQTVDVVSFGELPINVILALDMSESIGPRLRLLRNAGRSLVGALRPGDQAALITFSHAVALAADLSTETAAVRQALDQVAAFGETALVDAAYAGIVLGESDQARSLLIMFSDGLDTASYLHPSAVHDMARRTDTVVYAVSANIPARATFLRELTRLSGGALLEETSVTSLDAAFLDILDEFRHRYLLSYAPRGVTPGGWHEITVRVRGRQAEVRARPGYLAGS
ncbi:MAG TPA: VWA domain-containing protein [Vicinamibacterales bacterium]|nr:VWA domain-containing protein [Vicinamibacterales bacterium]